MKIIICRYFIAALMEPVSKVEEIQGFIRDVLFLKDLDF